VLRLLSVIEAAAGGGGVVPWEAVPVPAGVVEGKGGGLPWEADPVACAESFGIAPRVFKLAALVVLSVAGVAAAARSASGVDCAAAEVVGTASWGLTDVVAAGAEEDNFSIKSFIDIEITLGPASMVKGG
jgi:hypothetical protein